jgi:hypothetical protein
MENDEYTPKTWEQRIADWLEIHDTCQDIVLECARSNSWKGSGGADRQADSALAKAFKLIELRGGSDYSVDTGEDRVFRFQMPTPDEARKMLEKLKEADGRQSKASAPKTD